MRFAQVFFNFAVIKTGFKVRQDIVKINRSAFGRKWRLQVNVFCLRAEECCCLLRVSQCLRLSSLQVCIKIIADHNEPKIV